MFQTKHLFTIAILLLAAAGAVTGQTTQPSDPVEVLKVRAASRAFLVAMTQDDPAALRGRFGGTDEDFKLVEQMRDMLKSAKHLRTSSEMRWPATFADGRDNGIADSKSMIEKLDREDVTIDGDTANFTGGIRLKRIKGAWQVVDMMTDPKKKPMLGQMLGVLAKAADETAGEVDEGKFADFSAARTSMGMKIRKMLAAGAATKPAP